MRRATDATSAPDPCSMLGTIVLVQMNRSPGTAALMPSQGMSDGFASQNLDLLYRFHPISDDQKWDLK